MSKLGALLDTYLILRDRYAVTNSLVSKSTKGANFHETVFFGQVPDEAKRRLATAKSDLDDWAIVALLSVFERILFEHPQSPLLNKAAREGARGIDKAIEHFKPRVSSPVFEDVKRLGQYRNWVAHGKRWKERPASADPISSYQRLVDFLSQAGLDAK